MSRPRAPIGGAAATAWARVVCGLALVAATLSCGGSSPSSPSPAAPSPAQAFQVQYASDGDTLAISPSYLGATSVRLLNLDAPETGGDTQEPWATQSRAALRDLLPAGTAVRIETDRTATDTYGRVLGHVIRVHDGLAVNRDQLRQGHAVLYVIWPNTSRFDEYRAAQIEAQDAGRGIWSPASRLPELPSSYRLRQDQRPATWPVGDYLTRYYVEGSDWSWVHVNNRVYFQSVSEASAAGFTACPRGTAGEYQSACFAAGR